MSNLQIGAASLPQEQHVNLSLTNPALEGLPRPTSLQAALDQLTIRTSRSRYQESDEPDFTPKREHGRAHMQLARAALASAMERDVTDAEFQPKLYGALNILHHRRNAHGHLVYPARVSLAEKFPRGLIVCAPTGLEENSFRAALQGIYKSEASLPVVKSAHHGVLQTVRVPALSIGFPPNGDPNVFLSRVLQEFNAALNEHRTPASLGLVNVQQRLDGRLLNAIGIAINLGVLIVYGIRTKDARAGRAGLLFSILNDFTTSTGIPVVLLTTPGAVSAIAEHGGVIGSLCSLGLFSVCPEPMGSMHWTHFCEVIWNRYLAKFYGETVPPWFPEALWERTQGLNDLAVRVCDSLANRGSPRKRTSLNPEVFNATAGEILASDAAYLRAMRTASGGGKFERASVRRFGDWLPLDLCIEAITPLDDTSNMFVKNTDDADEREGMPT